MIAQRKSAIVEAAGLHASARALHEAPEGIHVRDLRQREADRLRVRCGAERLPRSPQRALVDEERLPLQIRPGGHSRLVGYILACTDILDNGALLRTILEIDEPDADHQRGVDTGHRLPSHGSETTNQAPSVDRPDLIEKDDGTAPEPAVTRLHDHFEPRASSGRRATARSALGT